MRDGACRDGPLASRQPGAAALAHHRRHRCARPQTHPQHRSLLRPPATDRGARPCPMAALRARPDGAVLPAHDIGGRCASPWSAILGVVAIMRPWPRAGFGFAENWYPDRALRFLDEQHLARGKSLQRCPFRRLAHPQRLARTTGLSRRPQRDSRTAAPGNLGDLRPKRCRRLGRSPRPVADRHRSPALPRTDQGHDTGWRGPRTARVLDPLVPPRSAGPWSTGTTSPSSSSDDRQYRQPSSPNTSTEVAHPDDFEHLTEALRTDPELRRAVTAELRRALADDPNCRRALDLAVFLDSLPGS